MKLLVALFGLMTISLPALSNTEMKKGDVPTLSLINEFINKCPVEFARATSGRIIFGVYLYSEGLVGYGKHLELITGNPANTLGSPPMATTRVTLSTNRLDAVSATSEFEPKFFCAIKTIK